MKVLYHGVRGLVSGDMGMGGGGAMRGGQAISPALRFHLGLWLLGARGTCRPVPAHFGERRADTLRVWARQPDLTHDAVDRTRKRVFQIFTYVHLDRRIRLIFVQRLGALQEHPHNVLMRFVGCVSVEGLVVGASRENVVRTYAVNLGMWPIEGPVKREEADGRVHTPDSASQVFTVFAEVIVSEITLSPSSGSMRASLTYQQ
jgi:hypothetical protein